MLMHVSGDIRISNYAAFPADTDCLSGISAVIIALGFGRSISESRR